MNFSQFEWQNIDGVVIGVDEVGRGCLAGHVYAAAVRIDSNRPFSHFTDSKKISEKRRERLSDEIHRYHEVAIAFASVEEIYDLNILQASLLAMKRAIHKLGYKNGTVLVDGNQKIPDLEDYRQICLVKGDLRAEPIGAASIAAKVARDKALVEYAQKYPGYGFESHKGYGTKIHRQAIEQLGPTPIHRRGFAGVKEHWRFI